MDRDRKTEGGATSEPAFDMSQVCLRVRSLFGLTGELIAAAQMERRQGGTRLEHNDVTCVQLQPWECFCETCRLVCLTVSLLVQSGVSKSFPSGTAMLAARVKSPPNQGTSQHTRWSCTHTHTHTTRPHNKARVV